jgi:hypothetical protein
MSGDKSLFCNLEKHEGGVVTFGDGNSSKVIGKGKVSSSGVPILENVLYVRDLKANLLSISQFCDEDYEIKFSKNDCTILDHGGNVICYGSRTSDNCYIVGTSHKLKCNSASFDIADLWHQRLGHVNHKELFTLSKQEVVRGILKMKSTTNR